MVAVYTSSMVASRKSATGVPRGLEDLLRQFGFQVLEDLKDMVMILLKNHHDRESTGVGSGVIISSDGYHRD